MKEVREIIVVSLGDSNDITFWSNVPFLLCQSLEDYGIIVDRINADVRWKYLDNYSTFASLFCHRILGLKYYDAKRTLLYRFFQKLYVKKEFKRYPDADVVICMCFNIPVSIFTPKKVVMYGDWNYAYLINKIVGIAPSHLERRYINYENQNIRSADLVIGMFKGIANYLIGNNLNRNVKFLGNTINVTFKKKESELEEFCKKKYNSNTLLFIGTQKYRDSAIEIASSVRVLNQLHNTEYKLSVIGMNAEAFPDELHSYIECYGYLDKNKLSEKEKYYKLLEECKCIINTSKGWAGFNSLVECMLFYTPLVVCEFEEFRETFKDYASFTISVNSTMPVESAITQMMSMSFEDYKKMSIKAHEDVKEWNWTSFTDKLIKEIEVL